MQISDGQIDEITRLYGDFMEVEKVKIFPNEAFGYIRITVERPLRVRWEITEETIAAALAGKVAQKWPEDVLLAVRELLQAHRGAQFAVERELVTALGPAVGGLGLSGSAQKALWSALAVRDDEAPISTDRKGNSEPDPELRENENVPLPSVSLTFEEDPGDRLATLEYRTAIDDYMRDDVVPYVPDAWVDYAKTKIGYDIPLARYFYKYVPPRPLEEIDAEIKALEGEIQRLLGEVAG